MDKILELVGHSPLLKAAVVLLVLGTIYTVIKKALRAAFVLSACIVAVAGYYYYTGQHVPAPLQKAHDEVNETIRHGR